MAEIEQMPFLKQLVDSDRKVRDKALDSLRLYLTSGRDFSELELMKLWRGLFFCMYHTAPPRGPPQLATSLTTLLLALPTPLSIPFQRAFWRTHAALYPTLDQHRLDKFLLLMRRYVNGGLAYLATLSPPWRAHGAGGVDEWIALMVEEGAGPLCVGAGEADGVTVGDGVRYHVLDVWVDEMEKAGVQAEMLEKILTPVRQLAAGGRTRVTRKLAKEVLADERLKAWGKEGGAEAGDDSGTGEGEEFGGFD